LGGTDENPKLSRKGFRVDVGTILFLLIAINSLGAFRLFERNLSCPDLVAAYEKKFAKLAAQVNPEDIAGYAADNERYAVQANGKPDPNAIDLYSTRRFFICQFVFAPTILVHSLDKARIVGNFSSPESAKAETASKGLTILQDGGNGAVLCGHAGKQ
jgi:hypothetical protein